MKKNTLLTLSIIGSVTIILLQICRWSLVDLLTPFIEPFVEIIVWGFFCIILISSLGVGAFRFKKEKQKAFVPFIINLITILVVIFVPFTRLTTTFDFWFHIRARENIIEMIQHKELVPNVSYNEELIVLPKKYSALSKGGGEVLVQTSTSTLHVFFFTFRGVVDNFSGFIYRSDDAYPSEGDFGCEYMNVLKMKNYWYWVSCS